ncbi:gliding motility lipoprotein GldH [Taibaiella koreensis]|uniref:gliding motility lipoprotein GldH n=1 Tax=Taibaiella koreensis TaxID=1268548 RepID=UPI000E5A0EF8|nr:gliding motility lipoprotein GldH [Taibaiella koreensis]
MKKHFASFVLGAIALLLTAASCGVKSSYYQKQESIPGAKWDYKFQPVFAVDISDTQSLYRFYLLVRHDEGYPNANLWLSLKVKAPGDTTFSEGVRIEKDLADPKGEWLGRGMGGIWEHKIPFNLKETPKLNKPGRYEFKIEQIMRSNPLPSVLNVGLIIEKIERH